MTVDPHTYQGKVTTITCNKEHWESLPLLKVGKYCKSPFQDKLHKIFVKKIIGILYFVSVQGLGYLTSGGLLGQGSTAF